MIGRLHISIDDAVEAYVKLAGESFSELELPWKEGAFKASNLERAISILVGENLPDNPTTGQPAPVSQSERDQLNVQRGKEITMLDPRPEQDRCLVFVCAAFGKIGYIPRFRTYEVTADLMPDCTIWEGIRATMTAPTLFKPIVILDGPLEMHFVNGSAGCSNPTKELLDEAAKRFPGHHVATVVNLGAGYSQRDQLRPDGLISKLQLIRIPQTLQKIATSCEETHDQLVVRFKDHHDVYFRFNVESGMQRVGLQEWKRVEEVRTHTRTYVEQPEIQERIRTVVAAMINRPQAVSVKQAAGLVRVKGWGQT
ncbi:patatin-like phospholipase protein [Ceratobasidium sp. AG-Ba]|nr:patatin-like phospholipase protein [Ceratobasidium sp. AG-Ba]QRW02515.1 patatin-like phospholipase protein [Ceratobasidium sp. AG-Ba]